jgi:iron complex outermembrane receptor protein
VSQYRFCIQYDSRARNSKKNSVGILAARSACIAAATSGLLLFAAIARAQSSETPQPQSGDAVILPTVTITGQTPEGDASDLPPVYAGGQVATGARLGALGNQNVMDTPFNITSYTSELIQNQQARTIGDVLTNDPSVRFTTSSGHAYENFRLRGFDVNQNDMSINGMYGLTPIGHTPVEMFERVEVLKGPSALFSGMAPSGAVGGTINLVPKRAGEDPLNRASVGYQSDGQYLTSADLSRRFGQDNALGVRVNGSLSDGETDIDGQKKRREFLSTAVDYRNERIKASVDVYNSKESFSGGTPAMFWMAGTVIPAAPDPSINQFPAAWGDLDSKAAIARAEYSFNESISTFAGIGVRKHDYVGFINGTHVRNINAVGVSTTTTTGAQRGYDDAFSSEAGFRFNFDTAGVAHELVLQGSRLETEAGSASATSTFTTNIYSPAYRAMPGVPTVSPKTSENALSSVALVDTLSFMAEKVRLTLGARQQRVDTTNYNATGAETSVYDDSVVTPAVGVVVKPWGPDLSLYANYVQGLSKGDSVTTAQGYAFNKTFAPYVTEQKEMGVKWNAGTFTNTVGLFEITKPTLIMINGTQPSDGGEKRVRGLEWYSFGEVLSGVRLLGGVALMDGVQTKSANNTNNGKKAVGVPDAQANLSAEWDIPRQPGLTFTSGLTSTSSQYLNSANTQEIPGWTIFDLGVRYSLDPFGHKAVVRLDVTNIFDKHYYSGAFSDTTPIATLGLGRTIMLSTSVDF